MKEKSIIKALSVTVFLYLPLYFLSVSALKDIYLYEWTARRLYCGIWVFAILLIAYEHTILSHVISVGNLFGIVFGQSIGDQIIVMQMNRISENSSPEEIYYAQQHYGAFIWGGILLFSIMAGIWFEKKEWQKVDQL